MTALKNKNVSPPRPARTPELFSQFDHKYKNMIEQIQDYAILLLNSAGDIETWNAGAQRIKGYEIDEIIGKNFRCFYTEEDQLAKIPERFLLEAAEKGCLQKEGWRLRKGGEKFWASVTITALHDANGRITGYGKVTHDLTEQKSAQEKIKNITAQLSLILDNAGEGIYGLDTEGRTTFANKAAIELLGYKLEEMIGVSQHDLIHHHYADGKIYEKQNCNIYKAFKDGKIHTEDKEVFWKKNGQPLPVEYTSTPIRDGGGDICGAVVVFRDITERKKAEEALYKLAEELSQKNKDLDHFAHITSHDLRSPLRGIANLTEFIDEDLENNDVDAVRENLDLLRGRVKRMDKMLNDILAYSKAGAIDFEMEDVDCNSLVNEVVSWVGLPDNFSINIEGALPTLHTSRTLLQQIFLNLLSNAVKHHDREIGNISIRYKAAKDRHEFEIEDDGPGIAEAHHDRVFKMFQTLRARDEVEGSGIGLAIVKKMVESIGGAIWIRKANNERGTVIGFSAPATFNGHSTIAKRF